MEATCANTSTMSTSILSAYFPLLAQYTFESFPRPATERTAQLDAAQLDRDLTFSLSAPFAGVVPFAHSAFDAVLMLLALSRSTQHSSFGASMQNLRFSVPLSATRRVLFGLGSILPAILARFQLSKMRGFQLLRKIFAALSLVSFVLFLRDGRYPTILHRLLAVRYEHANPVLTRHVGGYEIVNRLVIWESFVEFFLVVWPMLPTAITRPAAPIKPDPNSSQIIYRASCGCLHLYMHLARNLVQAQAAAQSAWSGKARRKGWICDQCGVEIWSGHRETGAALNIQPNKSDVISIEAMGSNSITASESLWAD